jgi:hypothetical protein
VGAPESGRRAAQDTGSAALRSVEQRAGRLALSHFRRVKQLGTGDVGLVDLVELQQGGSRRAPCPQTLPAGTETPSRSVLVWPGDPWARSRTDRGAVSIQMQLASCSG